MSPKEAKIFIAEDDPNKKGYLKPIIVRSGHEIVLEASTLEEAMTSIKEAREKGVNVALVDGSLAKPPLQRPGDGLEITRALREAIPDIRIVSISDSPTKYGDIQVGLEQAHKIGEIIDKL